MLSEIESSPSINDQDIAQMDLKFTETNDTPATFCGLSKIEKAGTPLRPITSCINLPAYNLSKYLVSILTPLLDERYSVKNSFALAMKLLEFVLRNSYFTHEEEHYHQTFGCAMGSPVRTTLANLVMEFVDDRTISTAAHPP